jgi:hypothetical protein
VLFRWGRLSIGSKQGDVTLCYQPFCDGEVLMGKASAPSRIYGLIAVNEFVQGLRRGSCVVAHPGRDQPDRCRLRHRLRKQGRARRHTWLRTALSREAI